MSRLPRTPVIVKCPVCWRTVTVTETGRVRRHWDTAGRTCVMFGHHYPLELIEHERRAS